MIVDSQFVRKDDYSHLSLPLIFITPSNSQFFIAKYVKKNYRFGELALVRNHSIYWNASHQLRSIVDNQVLFSVL